MTSLAWTLADLARRLTATAFARAVDEAFSAKLVTDRQLADVLTRRPTPTLQQLVDGEHNLVLTRSEAERLMIALTEAGLPIPLTNVDLHGFNVDFYWPEHKLVVEVDGLPYHSRRFAFERDRRKDQALRRHGLQPLRIAATQLKDHPVLVAVLIAQNLETR